MPRNDFDDLSKAFMRPDEAAAKLGVNGEIISRLVAKRAVNVKRGPGGEVLVNAAEAALLLGIDTFSDDMDVDQAELTLLIRRIKHLDIRIKRETLALEEQMGKVMPIAEVKQGRIQRIQALRTKLLSLPRDVAPELYGKGIEEIEDLLKEKITKMISYFAGKSQ